MRLFIVIPTLNSYKDLPKLLYSLKSQTYIDWRALFIDGNSSKKHQNFLERESNLDSRIKWVLQKDKFKGIYGAMNQGFLNAKNEEWVIFWGSDDYAKDKNVFEKLVKNIEVLNKKNLKYDLFICSGKYIDNKSLKILRNCDFNLIHSFRFSLFLGLVPTHQTCIFGPGIRRLIDKYDRVNNPNRKLERNMPYDNPIKEK